VCPAVAGSALGPLVLACWDLRLDGLYLAVTHRGVTLAPVLGRLVADELAIGEPAWLLARFRPGRFAQRATRVVLDIEQLFQ
jgi:glycine/D-amino acid oxidase-like deaminating enzyme